MLMRQFLQSGDPWKSRVVDSCLDLWAVQGPLGWELRADADFLVALTLLEAEADFSVALAN